MLLTPEMVIAGSRRVTLDLCVRPSAGDSDAAITCRGEVTFNGETWIAVPDLVVRASGAVDARHVATVSGDRLRFVVEPDGRGGARAAVGLRVNLDSA